MITYYDLAKYTKENHISLSTDLFNVLRGFFIEQGKEKTDAKTQAGVFQHTLSEGPARSFHYPADGEYTSEDVLSLFST